MSESEKLHVRTLRLEDEAKVLNLWKVCNVIAYPNMPPCDIRRKLALQPELLLVVEVRGQIVATVMAGYDGRRGWINYLAVDPDHWRGGHGRRMMREAEDRLRTMGCPKVNLLVRDSNLSVIDFYERLSYERAPVVCLSRRLDEPAD